MIDIYGGKDPRDLPRYSTAEAAHYACGGPASFPASTCGTFSTLVSLSVGVHQAGSTPPGGTRVERTCHGVFCGIVLTTHRSALRLTTPFTGPHPDARGARMRPFAESSRQFEYSSCAQHFLAPWRSRSNPNWMTYVVGAFGGLRPICTTHPFPSHVTVCTGIGSNPIASACVTPPAEAVSWTHFLSRAVSSSVNGPSMRVAVSRTIGQ